MLIYLSLMYELSNIILNFPAKNQEHDYADEAETPKPQVKCVFF